MDAKTKKESPTNKTEHSGSECGAQHSDCPDTWKGTCDREAGHDGSHHCDRCNSAF